MARPIDSIHACVLEGSIPEASVDLTAAHSHARGVTQDLVSNANCIREDVLLAEAD